jgi:hypothetical protein
MNLAKGKYSYFMDSDDILEECALEVLYERLEADQLTPCLQVIRKEHLLMHMDIFVLI